MPTRQALMLLALCAAAPATASEPGRTTTVGMPARVDQLVLPGGELEVAPIEDLRTPVVTRIVEVYRHGPAFRYDLEYYAIRPGEYDLVKFLRRKDGSKTEGLAPVPVTVKAVLPPGRVEPHGVGPARSPALGGYRTLLLVGGMAWSAGLVVILFLVRRRPVGTGEPDLSRPPTPADRLRPLVERAVSGTLGPAEHAELERLLIGYWQRRLNLESVEPGAAMAEIRRHGEAGPLISLLEEWLHKPGGAGSVDLAASLTPYLDIAAGAHEAVEGPSPPGRAR